MHVVNIAYTILDDLTSVSSPHGNHSLAILEVPENYDSLEKSLADILKEAEELLLGGRYEIFSSRMWD